MRSKRPNARPPSEALGLPHCGNSWNTWNQNSGARERSGVYHSFSRAQAGFLRFTIYSARIGLLVQAISNWSLNTRKHALTNLCLFTSMSPLPGVRGMLGASQFVNLLLFQFSGPCVRLSAQPLLCSLPCDSSTLSFSTFCLRGPQADFCGAHGKTYTPRSKWGAVNQRAIHGEQAARFRAAIIYG
jgi:hypothetical protein